MQRDKIGGYVHILGVVLLVIVVAAIAYVLAGITKYKGCAQFEPVVLEIEAYTVSFGKSNYANATKLYIKHLGGGVLDSSKLFISINGYKSDLSIISPSGRYMFVGDTGVAVAPSKVKVNQRAEIMIGIKSCSGGTVIYDKSMIVQKAHVKGMERGLLAEWHFEDGDYDDPDGDGLTVFDLSGNDCHGGYSFDPPPWYQYWVDGINGKAIKLIGGNNWIWFDPKMVVKKLNPRKAVTYEMWVYPMACGSSETFLIYNSHWARSVRLSSDCKVVFVLGTENGTHWLWSNTKLIKNKWNYVVATYDGSKMRLYINGNLDAEQDASGLIVSASSVATMTIGKGFVGIVDEVYVWGKALTASEVKSRYESYAWKI